MQPMLQAMPLPEPPGEIVVVTGKALPDARAERNYHTDVLGERELADAPAHELDSILSRVPGLQLFRRSDSTSGHPTSQGVTLRALGGNAASRALLILDGVPQSDPFGGWVNWPAYDPAGLEQVKVLRGGGGVSHGSGALAGTIELTSLSEAGFNGAIEGGSRRSLRGHALWGETIGGGLLTVDAQGGRSDGFVPVTKSTRGLVDREAPYAEASLRARWMAPVAEQVELQLAGLAFVDDRDRGVPFTDNRTSGGDVSVRLVGRGHWQWTALGYGQWRTLESSFASVGDGRASASRVSFQDSVPSRGIGGSIEVRPPLGAAVDLRLGADSRFVTGESRELFAYVGGEPSRRRISGGRSATIGVFVESSLSRGALTLSGGLRLDHWRIMDGELTERPLGGPPSRVEEYPERAGWRPTGRVSAVYVISTDLSGRLAAYSGWRLPTLNELFRPFRAGPDATAANGLLDPERLAGIEAGFRFERGPVKAELTGFINRLSDAVANVTIGHGPGVFPGVGFVAGDFRQRQNIDAVRVRGIEGSAEARRGPWSLSFGASLTDARVDADGAASSLNGLRPAQTPDLVLTGAIGWQQGRRSASVQLRHVGPQYEDDLNRNRLPSATTVDAFVAWPIARQWQLIARAQNLMNEEVLAGIAEDGTAERATPRTLWFGLRFGAD